MISNDPLSIPHRVAQLLERAMKETSVPGVQVAPQVALLATVTAVVGTKIDAAGEADNDCSSADQADSVSLAMMCELFKQELDCKSENLIEVVNLACQALGMGPMKGVSLVERARLCHRAMYSEGVRKNS